MRLRALRLRRGRARFYPRGRLPAGLGLGRRLAAGLGPWRRRGIGLGRSFRTRFGPRFGPVVAPLLARHRAAFADSVGLPAVRHRALNDAPRRRNFGPGPP
ncbi:MAG: hypothetical protein ABI914_07440, partial [Acidobacteriota bacterium]